METLRSLSLISLDLKAFAPDFLPDFTSSVIIRVKCSLECRIHFCYDVNSLRAALCPIHIYMPHNASNTVEIQYIFMDQVNDPVLCEANLESNNRKYFTSGSSKLFILWIWHLQQWKKVAMSDLSKYWLIDIDAACLAMWPGKRFLHKVSGLWCAPPCLPSW